MGHFFACVWLTVGISEQLHGAQLTWLTEKSIENDQWFLQYLYAYYFSCVTMITIGYGDITASTPLEILILIFLMLISCGIFGYNLNSMNRIFLERNKMEN